ncbi:MAG: FAD-dependent oxidoreductase [Pirellulales bacterium]
MHDDLLILGGGVIGLSTAWVAAQRGARVRVLDSGEPGREASWAGAGIIPPTLSPEPVDPPLEALLRQARAAHPSWSRRLSEATGIDNEYRVCGAWYVARNEADVPELNAWRTAFDEAGYTTLLRDDAKKSPHDLETPAEESRRKRSSLRTKPKFGTHVTCKR